MELQLAIGEERKDQVSKTLRANMDVLYITPAHILSVRISFMAPLSYKGMFNVIFLRVQEDN